MVYARTYVLAPMFWHVISGAIGRVAIDVLAPMCWHVISGACVLGHAFARSPTDMRVCANVCACVCQVVSHITSDMPRASQPEALTARSTS